MGLFSMHSIACLLFHAPISTCRRDCKQCQIKSQRGCRQANVNLNQLQIKSRVPDSNGTVVSIAPPKIKSVVEDRGGDRTPINLPSSSKPIIKNAPIVI